MREPEGVGPFETTLPMGGTYSFGRLYSVSVLWKDLCAAEFAI